MRTYNARRVLCISTYVYNYLYIYIDVYPYMSMYISFCLFAAAGAVSPLPSDVAVAGPRKPKRAGRRSSAAAAAAAAESLWGHLSLLSGCQQRAAERMVSPSGPLFRGAPGGGPGGGLPGPRAIPPPPVSPAAARSPPMR